MEQLFAGSTNALEDEWIPLFPAVGFRDELGAGFVEAPGLAVTVPGIPENQQALLQLRVWDNQGGTVTNWSQSLSNETVLRGQSRPFLSPPLGGILLPPPNLVGLESFNIAGMAPPPPPHLSVELIESAEGFATRLTFPRHEAMENEIEASSDFGEWLSIGTPVAVDSQTMEFIDAQASEFSRRFYRIRILNSP